MKVCVLKITLMSPSYFFSAFGASSIPGNMIYRMNFEKIQKEKFKKRKNTSLNFSLSEMKEGDQFVAKKWHEVVDHIGELFDDCISL